MVDVRAKTGDIALYEMRAKDGAITGYAYAVVVSADRDGRIKTAERSSSVTPRQLRGVSFLVGRAGDVGCDVALRSSKQRRTCSRHRKTAQRAIRKWMQEHGAAQSAGALRLDALATGGAL
jgi:hypothetical protein